MRATFACAAALLAAAAAGRASDADALAISANIQARHTPFGGILDPIYASSTSDQVIGYTRCGDSALWTSAYLAAESFRYKLTHSADALINLRKALAAINGLSVVTGNNQLARCMVAANSPYAPGIASEEAANRIVQNPPWIWVANTSRDQIVAAFFGLGVTFDLVDDAVARGTASDIVTRLIGFISRHQWSPDDDIASTFTLRPEELQMLLQVARHLNPSNTVSGPFLVPPVNSGVLFDIQSDSSYFKFNLDYLSFYQLILLQDNGDNRGAYATLRSNTASHQNALFNMIDRALRGPDPARDAETRALLDQWLKRPKRDFYVDVSPQVPVCGSEACQPIPVPMRPPATFLWEVNPFQLKGGGSGIIENAGVDYLLPYWMGRYYGAIPSGVQSSAAAGTPIAPGSLATFYGQNLVAATAQAMSQPLPLSLGGASLVVTDAAGVNRTAPLLYVSPGQVNFVVPDGVATGTATFAVTAGGATQRLTATVQPVAPTLFTMNGTGGGVAAALGPTPVFQCSSTGCSTVPITLGDQPVYLSFYGTGLRNRGSLANVTATINGTTAAASFAGPAPGFTGLDQVNVALPASLRGAGESIVYLTVDGQNSNVVNINVK